MRWFAAISSAVVIGYASALSAAEPLDPNLRRGLKREPTAPTQPYVEPAAAPQVDASPLALPELPATGLLAAIRLHLRGVRLEAPADLDPALLDDVDAPYVGRELDAEELELLRQAYLRRLQEQGYLGASVELPDQDVAEGILSYRISVARLAAVEFSGAERLARAELERPLQGLIGQLLRLDRLQEALREIDADPRVRRLDAALEPTGEPGSARLQVAIDAAALQSLTLAATNDRPRSSGRERGSLGYRHLSLFGRNDELALEYGESEGSDDWSASYRLPLAASPASLLLSAGKSDVRIITAPFDRIDIEGASRQESLGFGWWWYRNAAGSAEWSLSLDRTRSKASLLDQPFSFAPGEVDGGSRVAALRLMLDWERRTEHWAQAAVVRLSRGLSAFDATTHRDGLPDSRFTSLFAQAQHLQTLGEHYEWTVRAAGQWADDALLPSEKFALGGESSLRGSEPNVLVRDNGWLLGAEFRRQFPLDWPGADRASLGLFLDGARGWNNQRFAPPAASLATLGLTARLDGPRLGLSLTLGRPIHRGGALDEADLDDWRAVVQAQWRFEL